MTVTVKNGRMAGCFMRQIDKRQPLCIEEPDAGGLTFTLDGPSVPVPEEPRWEYDVEGPEAELPDGYDMDGEYQLGVNIVPERPSPLRITAGDAAKAAESLHNVECQLARALGVSFKELNRAVRRVEKNQRRIRKKRERVAWADSLI